MLLAAICMSILASTGTGTPRRQTQSVDKPNGTAVSAKTTNSDQNENPADRDALKMLTAKALEIEEAGNKIADQANKNEQRSIDLQRELGRYTLGLVLVAVVQAIVYYFTLHAIRKQGETLRKELEAGHRAWIFVGDIQSPLGNELRLGIGNNGHTTGHVTSAKIKVIALENDGTTETYLSKPTSNKQCSIRPGATVGLRIAFPQSLKVHGRKSGQVSVSGNLYYRTGFGEDDVPFNRTYDGLSQTWITPSPEVLTIDVERAECGSEIRA